MTGLLIWVTGLAGAGKSTMGKALYQRIKAKHPNTILLDGDIFRAVMGSHVSYTLQDRLAMAQRIAQMCHFLVNQDMIVICATMSLFTEIHTLNRQQVAQYYEIFIHAEFDELIRRDQKGLYSAALAGNAKNVVGVDLHYDLPQNCDLTVDNTQKQDVDETVSHIIKQVEDKFLLTLT